MSNVVVADHPLRLLAQAMELHESSLADEREADALAAACLQKRIEAGRLLNVLKATLGHGRWGSFLDAHVAKKKQRSLRDYMMIARYIDQIGDVANFRDARSQARAARTAERIAATAEKIRNSPPLLPEGPFPIIALDPPWPDPGARLQYPLMTYEEIEALPVGRLAAEDAALFLWLAAEAPMHAPRMLERWGFRFRQQCTWDKQRQGPGQLLRGRAEHFIIATRGKPLVTPGGCPNLIIEPRREHSRKPEAFFQMVEDCFPAPAGGRLDWFSRQKRPGWISYGAETDHFAPAAAAANDNLKAA